MFAHGREVHAAPNKARQVCERHRVGEVAVSCERPGLLPFVDAAEVHGVTDK
jgi:hypothetical protein